MLSKDEFTNTLVDEMRRQAKDENLDITVSLGIVNKTNYSYESLSVRKSDISIVPQVNLDILYEQYQKGDDMQSIIKTANKYIDDAFAAEIPHQEFIKSALSYENVKDRLFVRVCETSKNKPYLENLVTTPLNHLSCFYGVEVMRDVDGYSAFSVTEVNLNLWGITKEQLHQDAVESMNKMNPPCLHLLEEVAFEALGLDSCTDYLESEDVLEPEVYCLTNAHKTNGAAYICDESLMKSIGERLREDFYILPSSQHELLLLPKSMGMTEAEIQDMVRSVNETLVNVDEYLSDDILRYDLNEKHIVPVMDQRVDKKMEQEREMIKQKFFVL